MKVADKSNEIPAARELLQNIQLSGRIADAMHTQVETTQLILDRGADYLVKGKTILDDLKAIDWDDNTVGKSETKTHGRTRRCRVIELDKTWDGYVELSGRRQAFRRIREKIRKGKVIGTTSEIAVTSIPPSHGGPTEILDHRHWEIENSMSVT